MLVSVKGFKYFFGCVRDYHLRNMTRHKRKLSLSKICWLLSPLVGSPSVTSVRHSTTIVRCDGHQRKPQTVWTMTDWLAHCLQIYLRVYPVTSMDIIGNQLDRDRVGVRVPSLSTALVAGTTIILNYRHILSSITVHVHTSGLSDGALWSTRGGSFK